ncbi:MAG TPA: DUF6541 family protein [Acidimicrobiia bacterium]|nr:DUF6541 family protein [Acidimicrobiia bacterium]
MTLVERLSGSEAGGDAPEATGSRGRRPSPLSVAVCAVFAVLAALSPQPFLLAFVFAYPASFFIRVTRGNLWVALPAIALANAGTVIVFGGLLRIVGIPLRPGWLVAAAVLAVGVRYLAGDAAVWEPPGGDTPAFAVISLVFGLALLSRVASTFGVLAPILWDPYAHSWMTQSILETGTIEYFYAPGLHILSNFLAEATGSTAPLTVHYVTNVASAFSIVSWSLAALIITRRRTMAVAVAIFMFLGPYPERLYLEQGKNAFVLALALLPLVFIALALMAKRPTRTRGLALGGAVLVLFFVHHGTFLFVTVLTGFGVLVAAWSRRRAPRRDLLALLRSFVWAVGLVAVVGGLWLSLGLWDVNVSNDPIATFDYGGGYLDRLGGAIEAAYLAIRDAPYHSALDQLPLITGALIVVAVLGRGIVRTGALVVAAAGFLTPVLFPFVSLPLFNYLSREAASLLLLPLFTLAYAAAIQAAIDAVEPPAVAPASARRGRTRRSIAIAVPVLLLAAAVPVVSAHAVDTYDEFERESREQAMVTVDDTIAFGWIRDNLGPDPGFVNNAIRGSGIRSHAIFAADAGMWLPVFTSATVSMDFLSFASSRTHENFALFEALQSEEGALEAARALNARGYDYYYHTTDGLLGSPIDIDRIRGYEGVELEELFSFGTVKILRLGASG